MKRQIISAVVAAFTLVTGEASCSAEANEHNSPPVLIIDLPDGPAPYPVAIYAPGGGGNAKAEFPSALTKSLLKRGVAVVRFDWSFTPVPGSAQAKDLVSPGMAAEIADYSAALASVRHDRRFLSHSIILMGKSLGSIVAARVLSTEPKVAGAVFMTPVCSRPPKSVDPDWLRNPYPTLLTETRPIALISGEADPLCSPKALYGFAMHMAGAALVSVVDGDHGFGVGEPAANSRNFEFVAETSAAAAATILRKNN